ncbi:MAG: non-heme iron oxygenase ferredoxin subunit [Gemmatimonadetes bacterium]|nr:non-heme iron oxygenase ferredoxin subunit [Gemmatimonadota bacterium]
MGELIRVASVGEIPPGACRHVDAAGRAVALFNVDGTIYAIGGECTHKGGFLGEGELDGSVVTCPLHGAQFDVTTGRVVGPPASTPVPAYRVVVDGEDVKVEL